ncbi:iron-containing alcohol dehydrogenase [Saccharopolyspora flava]|uniref:Alcohol dehydrogenase, class IV n=1 Tax=Saccharopolyspora flava TaxID=95161 RepID=A0A1I6RM03_9PSEU|nr:iron-containing alcohol dehydrogenase [Saccharopolyspora flava]SFS65747.1 Alcohol dehydrogenase, class IV [Saccharopolyspora flava]
MINTIMMPRDMRVGGGAIDQIGDLAQQLGSARPLVVTDAFLVRTGLAERVLTALRETGLRPKLFADTVPDPTSESLLAGLEALKDGDCDAVIRLGGGSPMDTAKALALLAIRGGEMIDYKAPLTNTGPALPIIAVPTTAGSGSEATQFTIITDSETGEKMLCSGPAFLPVAAVIDYELTLSAPPRLTADTGIDALTHAVEAYVSKKANPFSDALCLTAISTIGAHLRSTYADGQCTTGRAAMMLAATQAGIAFSNSSVALIHGMSRPLGSHVGIAHGMSNAMLFPAVTEFSVPHATARYADCARAFGAAETDTADGEAATAFVAAIRDLCRDLRVPTPQVYGVDEVRFREMVPLMAEQALASGSPLNNPRVPSADEIADLFHRIYS